MIRLEEGVTEEGMRLLETKEEPWIAGEVGMDVEGESPESTETVVTVELDRSTL